MTKVLQPLCGPEKGVYVGGIGFQTVNGRTSQHRGEVAKKEELDTVSWMLSQ